MLRTSRTGATELLTIDRESAGNSFGSGVSAAFQETLARLEGDTGLRAVIVTGAGSKFFCAGGDIKEYATIADAAELNRRFGRARAVMDALEALPVPVIAAVNGYALGAGVELLLAADLRIAAPHASFALPQVRLGIVPGFDGIERLIRDLGPARAMRLLATGERIDADRALSVGLIDEIAADGPVLDAALALAKELEAAAPLALAATKRIVRAARDSGPERIRALSRQSLEQLWFSADHREAEAAFRERRRPVFTGR